MSGATIYAHVGNNPISNTDPNGTDWDAFIATLKDFAATHELMYGVGASAFGVLDGGSLMLNGWISVRGISVSLTACGGVGGGAYAGVGQTFGIQKLDPCKTETSTARVLMVEGGDGIIGGAAVDTAGNGSFALAKGGVGVGGYIAIEQCVTK